MTPRRYLLAVCAAALLAGCVPPTHEVAPAPPTQVQPPNSVVTVLSVPETYVSQESVEDELDSLATWPNEDGTTWLIATAKSTHRLVLFDADSGERLRDVGGKGAGPGQFNRPNGIAVFGDHLFVVERDNHRVQVLALPSFAPLGSFGTEQLRSPYGLWLREIGPGEVDAYVTDSFMEGARFDVVPPLDQLDQRVRRYRLAFDDEGKFTARSLGAFGDTGEATALRIVESIAGDPANNRLLIADEDRRHESTLREYDLEGHSTGRSLPGKGFGAEAEGVALWSCAKDEGYWIAVDQLSPLAIFHLFDRATLAARGSFSGTTVAHTDGIALHAAATARFPSGAMFAVHDDKAVAAFDLRDVAKALGLDQRCL